jgi:hypothetical protein
MLFCPFSNQYPCVSTAHAGINARSAIVPFVYKIGRNAKPIGVPVVFPFTEMKLTAFIGDLLEKGKVTVAGQIGAFTEEDLGASEALLRQYYQEDVLEMPGTAPEFSAEAALWGSRYLYYAVQLAALRDLGEDVVEQYLQDFAGPLTPAAIYSIDLTFRYLPDLLHLAKGMAPGDVLVAKLKKTALRWPFSSVGTEAVGEADLDVILGHCSLQAAYVDRIIREKDAARTGHPQITELVRQALGPYAGALWPGFENISK